VYAIDGYDAMNAALAAIQKAGKKDRAAIRDARMGTKQLNGVLGTWGFDQDGDTSLKVMTGIVIKDGKWAFSKSLPVK